MFRVFPEALDPCFACFTLSRSSPCNAYQRRTPQTPYASFRTSSEAEDLSILQTEIPAPGFVSELQRLRETDFDFAEKDSSKGSLFKRSLLSVTDDFSYTGREFEHRRVNVAELVTCELAGEEFSMEIQRYPRAYMSTLKDGASQPTLTDQSGLPGIPDPSLRTDNRVNYEEIDPRMNVTCATHTVRDKTVQMFCDVGVFLL